MASRARTDDGASGSPFDAYDFSHEWGRSFYDVRHFFFLGGSTQAPFKINLNAFILGNSGPPFNITTGRDTNGDTAFTERPAFARDLTKPGVIVTPIGDFDPNPTPGQEIIPRNFGSGPGHLYVNVGIEKTFGFGRALKPPANVAGETAAAPPAQSSVKDNKPPPIQRPFHLSLSIYAFNALNHANEGRPIGNLSSPYFLKSNGTGGVIFFGPGGAEGNRQVVLRVRLGF